ncbi:MAG TPA: M90 family metallopeptidase [Gemmatimonadales bacterium]|nr:M90 family metallopeptidase [Gemmatimonadales bacterium]
MSEGLVLLAGAALLAGAWFALGPLIRGLTQRAAAKREAEPVPASWWPLIAREVPAVAGLDRDQRTRLLRAMRDLLTTCHWEGCGGLVLTEEMQLVIAAQACLITLERPGELYPALHTILVYPSTFVPRRAVDLRKWHVTREHDPGQPTLGEAWSDGIVVLAWDDAGAGAANPADGRNVVYHEFAHQLDFVHHLTDPDADAIDPLRQAIRASYDRLCEAVAAGSPTVLDRYAVTDEAEFFAVATEVYFERKQALQAVEPRLVKELERFYEGK